MPKGKHILWTPAMHRFCDQRRDMLRRELAVAFNKRFNMDLSMEAVRNFCKRNGYHTGRTGCFKKGNAPFNKGVKGWSAPGSVATQFKVGGLPANTVPVGTYRMSTPRTKTKRCGKSYDVPPYWRVKVAENEWRFLHQLIWQDRHGSIPRGGVIIFLDGNTLNCAPDNLVCVSRGELAVLNRHSGFADAPVDVRSSIVARVKLQQAIHDRSYSMCTGPKGERKSLEALCEDYGKQYQTVRARMDRQGWTLTEALTTPHRCKPARLRRENAQA